MKKRRGKLHTPHNKHLPIEAKIATPALRKDWEDLRQIYELYRADALIPRARNKWTSIKKLLEAYDMYCTAINVPNRATVWKLGTLLRENFVMRRHDGTTQYGCSIREDLFVREDDVIKVQEG
jgi:hypothetical protein